MLIGEFFSLKVDLMNSPMASAPKGEACISAGVSLSLGRECDIVLSVISSAAGPRLRTIHRNDTQRNTSLHEQTTKEQPTKKTALQDF